MQFLQLHKLRDLDLRSGRGYTGAHVVEVYPHTKLDGNRKNFCGRMDGRTDKPQFQSTRSSVGDDLIMNEIYVNIEEHQKNKNIVEKTSESVHR